MYQEDGRWAKIIRAVDRILAISDVHGQNKKLLDLLKETEYNHETDLLILVGDMIDRGEENLDTIATCEELRRKGAILLKGNHEQFLQESLVEMIHSESWRSHPSKNLYYWYTYNGGASMYHEIRDLSKERLEKILKFTQALPLYFSSGNYIFTHAGANTTKPIELNTEDEVVWMEDGFPYCPAYSGKVLIFGHIPIWKLDPHDQKLKRQNAEIWYDKINKDKIGIDCGGVFGGRLAAIELPTYREFYVR